MNNKTKSIPNKISKIVLILAILVIGNISPYPVVAIVTILKYIHVIILPPKLAFEFIIKLLESTVNSI